MSFLPIGDPYRRLLKILRSSARRVREMSMFNRAQPLGVKITSPRKSASSDFALKGARLLPAKTRMKAPPWGHSGPPFLGSR